MRLPALQEFRRQFSSLDEKAVAGNFLGLFLRFRHGCRYLMVRLKHARCGMDCADRQADHGMEYPFAAAVFADVAAALAVRLAVMRADGQLEGIENGLTARLPIFALKQNDEIVAANVADKVAVEVAMPDQYMSSHLDDVIPTSIAVDVVKRLEVIEVGVAGAECDSALQQPFDVFVDRDIAGQQSERICITGDEKQQKQQNTHQILAAAHADVAALIGDDEAVGQMMTFGFFFCL